MRFGRDGHIVKPWSQRARAEFHTIRALLATGERDLAKLALLKAQTYVRNVDPPYREELAKQLGELEVQLGGDHANAE